MMRSALGILVAMALAAVACGKYGPPVRTGTIRTTPVAATATPPAPAPDPDPAAANPDSDEEEPAP